ncbi:phosphate ABC transporter permease PtsA [Marinicauda salina]|uniref:Phosphate transport system permease protein PstA n=1 Tax=Marinicauda salina TaxID=2135793 RepID=A0A2U2BXT1_9PROT|nr:phosphate ABC transporter permease PstA [Marinicauda salina]PWE18828.1 phosphate ABC transporter permease PtsA [Marinicauda salina]
MTDAPASSRDIRAAVEARLAKRHRAERRFRAYGLGAIGLALVFLVLLLGSIVLQAAGAFTAHRLTLPVEIERAAVDPRGDMSEASLRRGSYNTVIQQALREQFPSVSDASALRELFGLYSAVNAARLLNQVVDDPDLVGERIEFAMPLSDDADLYLKGATVDETRRPGSAPITIAIEDGAARIEGEAPVFAAFLDAMDAVVRERVAAARERAEAARAAASGAATRDEAAAARAEAERSAALADRLEARLGADPVTLGPGTPSLFVAAADGVVAIERIAADGRSAVGTPVIAPQATGRMDDWTLWELETPPSARRISDRQIVWTRALEERGFVQNAFNTTLFTHADSREPELAGVLGAMIGSMLTMLVTMALAVPIGVGAAVYLEEFAPKNRITGIIEVNINNLAAVPSIVFGLLGLAVFINFFGLPRSAPLVGGMVLALMTLPTVIISSRAALKAVPPSIREAALGVGASKTQAVFGHVIPLAAPGMLTGSIIGLAQALGETAPLLMIGMVAFIADPPTVGPAGFTEPATVMPVQIFLWSGAAERAFEARTAAAILVLLALMVIFNAAAIWLRRRFERRW